jgi:uncharacterized protein (DUF2237 family)
MPESYRRTTTKRAHITDSLNVLGGQLETCSVNPVTGFFRDGCCETRINDSGRHIICAQVTTDFLIFSKKQGNDLISPNPDYNFPGLKAGDFWCICLDRWREALDAGCPPPIRLEATHEIALERIPLEMLKKHALAI